MKTILAVKCSFVAIAMAVLDAPGQSFSIDWHTVDSGGGTCAGGGYLLDGSVGQTDAGVTMSGGTYSLEGGFWSAVQPRGAPLLTVYLTNGNRVVVSWPSVSTGFALQQNASLGSANWVTPSETVTDNGTNKLIIVDPPTGNRFYRLFKP